MSRLIHCEDCAAWAQQTTNSGYCMLLPPAGGKYPLTEPRCADLRAPVRDPLSRPDFDMTEPGQTPSPGGCVSGILRDEPIPSANDEAAA